MEPFSHLLKPKEKFLWPEELGKLLRESKEKIIEAVKEGVRTFDPRRETSISTDWSRTGMGLSLTQKWCQCTEVKPNCCPDGWNIGLIQVKEEGWAGFCQGLAGLLRGIS